MTKKTHIEIFPGSISDLERMTGETFESVKGEDGRLLKFSSKECLIPSLRGINTILREVAKDKGYDAFVHVTYIPVASVNATEFTYIAYPVKKVRT